MQNSYQALCSGIISGFVSRSPAKALPSPHHWGAALSPPSPTGSLHCRLPSRMEGARPGTLPRAFEPLSNQGLRTAAPPLPQPWHVVRPTRPIDSIATTSPRGSASSAPWCATSSPRSSASPAPGVLPLRHSAPRVLRRGTQRPFGRDRSEAGYILDVYKFNTFIRSSGSSTFAASGL